MFFIIDLGDFTRFRVRRINFYIILLSVHPLKKQPLAIRCPEGPGNILIRITNSICPYDISIFQMNDSQLHFRIGVAWFGIMFDFQFAMNSISAKQRKFRHFAIIKSKKRNHFTVRRPPERSIARSPAQNFFIIHEA